MIQEQTTTRSETFPCDGPATVDVQVRAGRLAVRAADVTEIRVQVTVENDATADARAVQETEVSFSADARRLVIRAPRGFRRTPLSVEVDVPRQSRLTARLHRGSVSATGTLASLDAGTGSGDVRAEHVAGDTDANTGSGDIRLGRVEGRLRARSGSGEIEVAALDGEAAKVATGSGNIWLGAVRSDVQARTSSGRVVVADVAGGRLDLATGSGNVNVSVRAGVSAQIDLASGSGQTRSELEVLDGPPAETAPVRIRARTGSGDAVVARASG